MQLNNVQRPHGVIYTPYGRGNLSSQWRYFSERWWNGFSAASSVQSLFCFQTRLIAIKIVCMALAVTNAGSYRKRADIVFLWHDLCDFIIFWWITVYPECVHDARIFTWWRLAVIAPDKNGTRETSLPACKQRAPPARTESSWSWAGGRC